MAYIILVAEDDEDIVELLRLYLENEQYKVYIAANGQVALSILEKEKIDLAVVDIMMPVMNGYELIKKVREISNIPIIVLSAKNLDSDKILGLDIGADDYMTKPFNPLEIIARVKSNIRRFYQLNEQVIQNDNHKMVIGDLVMDTEAYTDSLSGKLLFLTP